MNFWLYLLSLYLVGVIVSFSASLSMVVISYDEEPIDNKWFIAIIVIIICTILSWVFIGIVLGLRNEDIEKTMKEVKCIRQDILCLTIDRRSQECQDEEDNDYISPNG